jgi:hypothetical protein
MSYFLGTLRQGSFVQITGVQLSLCVTDGSRSADTLLELLQLLVLLELLPTESLPASLASFLCRITGRRS